MGSSSNDWKPKGMGANPPPGREWEIGKDALTIRVVHALERLLQERLSADGVGNATIDQMYQNLIDDFKSGRKTFITTMPEPITDEMLVNLARTLAD